MTPGAEERAALVAIVRTSHRPLDELLEQLENAPSLRLLLEREMSGEPDGQLTLEPADAASVMAAAAADVARWTQMGFSPVTLLDADYPPNLRLVHDRPPLIFVDGALTARDERSLAIIGTRQASDAGCDAAARCAESLAAAGFTVVSGLAAGIDTAAHQAVLAGGGRTVAVIGSGLTHSYPAQNRALQARIAREAAVVSCFWPEAPPSPDGFRRRNAVMSGMGRGTLVIEASARSGARLQTRLALAQARPVFLWHDLRREQWARELSQRPGVRFVEDPTEVAAALDRLALAAEHPPLSNPAPAREG